MAFEVAKGRTDSDGSGKGSPVAGAVEHPERFDPDESAATLMDSEHRGRYRWAAQLVSGRSVLDVGCGTGYGLEILAAAYPSELTGVDIAPDAVAAARRRANGGQAEVVEGDLTALALPDDSFDVAICFETIEHLDLPEWGVAELRRVVRPGGLLVVSSPNPDVYPRGNEHHLHELRPDELLPLVQKHFKTARLFLQHAWLASAIEPAEIDRAADVDGHLETGVGIRRTTRPDAAGPTFAIVVGCDEEQPQPRSLISLGDPFEVRWWEDRVSEAKLQADAAITEAKLKEQELEAVRALREAEAREERLAKRLKDVGSALVDANQELAEAPLLKHRLAEMYKERAALEEQLDHLLGSRSWQITGFLRKLTAMLKLQR